MAKGKNLNPADALRKAQRKKELKKNKEQRQKTRDFALVKKDTTELDDEIAELEQVTSPTNAQKARLTEAKAELAKIMKKKEEYVGEHPEARGLVYHRRKEKPRDPAEGEGAGGEKKPGRTKRNLFNKHGLPRHPERSIYYDAVMNPYGMPPPGMPYVERALLPGEVDSEAEDQGDKEVSDSDDDIPLPEGPPPGAADEDGGGDDDIPLPEGPPPGEEEDSSQPPLPPGPPPLPLGPSSTMPMPPFAPNFPPQMVPGFFSPPPAVSAPGHPLLPAAFPPPPPPPSFGFSYPPSNLPPPPPGFFPRRSQAAGSIQDPLSNIPHTTYQSHRAARSSAQSMPISGSTPIFSTLPVNPNLPPKPVSAALDNTAPPKAGASASATVSAEPQLRDFKKESTVFVPAALKRKRAGGAGSGKVNAAPSVGANGDAGGAENDEGMSPPSRPDLLGSLREKFGPVTSAANPNEDGSSGSDSQAKKRKVEKPKDDYDKFLEEMGDVLNAPQ